MEQLVSSTFRFCGKELCPPHHKAKQIPQMIQFHRTRSLHYLSVLFEKAVCCTLRYLVTCFGDFVLSGMKDACRETLSSSY